jgi:hypothetical protein
MLGRKAGLLAPGAYVGEPDLGCGGGSHGHGSAKDLASAFAVRAIYFEHQKDGMASPSGG